MERQKDSNFSGNPFFAGIFGYNIRYSLSPLIHNKMSELSKIRLCYGSFDVPPETFKVAFNGFKSLKLKGANITQPYKVEVLNYIEYLSKEAKLIGSVNTVNLEDDGFYKGYNTDTAGFAKGVEYEFGIGLKDKNVLVLGAGGASRAILYSLIKAGAQEVLIINRNAGNAKRLFEEAGLWKGVLNSKSEVFFSGFNLTGIPASGYFKKCDIIINAMTPSEGSFELIKSLPLKDLNIQSFAMDISYNPSLTPFLELLNGKVLKCANGLSMLLLQAIESFYIWTGNRVSLSELKGVL
ncbi:MAG: shikimate dehydrogenase [Deltaproteobacteria bacterium]|nr:shikimate dehydrogenase [Deltaproteobacteria bacterium]